MSEKSTQSICNFNEYYKHYLALFVLTIVTFSHLVQAQPSDDEAGDNLITPEIIKTLENYSEKYRQQLVVPGMAIAIVHNGKIVYAKGLGYRQIGRQKTVNAKTLFSIGSLSKSMTAMMAGSIVDDGYMQWDTPINQVLPQFELSDPMVTQQITMKNLFSHSTGISPVDQMLMLSGLSFPEYLRYIKTVPLPHPVGTVFNYSNTMYSLGGYAAVAASGELKEDEWLESYRELMHERVFEPIGMKHSGLSAEFIEESKNRAFGHRSNLQANMTSAGFDVFTEAYWDIETQGPAGAVRSNAVDMAKYLITILNHGISPKGDVVISPSSSTEIFNPQINIGHMSYGLGWFNENIGDLRVHHHTGGIGGFSSSMLIVPEANFGFVILSNSNFQGSVLNQSIQQRLLELTFGFAETAEAQLLNIMASLGEAEQYYAMLAPVDAESVMPFIGDYANSPGRAMQLSLSDGHLWLHVDDINFSEYKLGPDGRYYAITDLYFFGGSTIELLRNTNGQLTMVLDGGFELAKIEASNNADDESDVEHHETDHQFENIHQHRHQKGLMDSWKKDHHRQSGKIYRM